MPTTARAHTVALAAVAGVAHVLLLLLLHPVLLLLLLRVAALHHLRRALRVAVLLLLLVHRLHVPVPALAVGLLLLLVRLRLSLLPRRRPLEPHPLPRGDLAHRLGVPVRVVLRVVLVIPARPLLLLPRV